jgi:3',5'-cyclic AMP phosphodiesterase CpdA
MASFAQPGWRWSNGGSEDDMPLYLPPISRRTFVLGSVAAAILGPRGARGADERPPADADRLALLSDTHVAADRAAVMRGVTVAEHLAKVVAEVAAVSPRPAAALVNGDLALGLGEAGDYATLLELVKPLREAGLPLHLTLGNHDHREHFRAAVPEGQRDKPAVADREAYAVESPRADWFVLDSLRKTNEVGGAVGEAQLHWLAEQLDARKDKPALVMVHHNPDEEDPTRGGLADTKALLDLLAPRKQVKALFFGHTHAWSLREREGLHLVNLPPVAYVFQAGLPSGWVDMKMAEGGATLQLRCVDASHRQHGEKHELKWR